MKVAIEAMQRKTSDLLAQVHRSPPDLKRLQLLLQGCVSTQVNSLHTHLSPPSLPLQVNQGVQEYAMFLSPQHSPAQSTVQLHQLKAVYR